MARGVNKAIIVGNVGQDPEVRYMPSGSAVAEVSVATSEQWKDKQSGEKQERTEWHRVTFFGRLAEVVGEYVRKGSQIYIEGSIRTEKWQDKQGQDRYTTKIIANEMQMLGGRTGGSTGFQQDAPSHAPSQSAPTAAAAPAGSSADFDDDIPF